MPQQKQRKVWLALLLSFFAPGTGLGQLYNRQVHKFFFFALLINFGFAVIAIVALRTPEGALAGVIASILVWIIAWMDAAISAKRIKSVELAWFNRWYVYLGLLLISYVTTSIATELVRQNYFEAFKFPSSSMQPTIIVGDQLIVQKQDWNEKPFQRGQMVLFTLPDDQKTLDKDESQVHILKRLIGLPGDQVELRGKRLILNGKPMDEPYAQWLRGDSKDFGPRLVPKNSIFVLGDNRDFSKDSRYYEDPFVPLSRVKGRALYVYWNGTNNYSRFGVDLQ